MNGLDQAQRLYDREDEPKRVYVERFSRRQRNEEGTNEAPVIVSSKFIDIKEKTK